MSQLQNVRSKFADNRKWPDCKSRSSEQENGKFWGAPVKEVGTEGTQQEESRGALREKNITLLVIPYLYSVCLQ